VTDYVNDWYDTFSGINFSYEMVRVTENRLEPEGKERGLFNYLFDTVEFNLMEIILIQLTQFPTFFAAK
jgi:hypothetical protein